MKWISHSMGPEKSLLLARFVLVAIRNEEIAVDPKAGDEWMRDLHKGKIFSAAPLCSFVLLSIVFPFFWRSTTCAYTYESEINPKEFKRWEIIQQTHPAEDYYGRSFAILKNPDLFHPIGFVLIQANGHCCENDLIGYAYYKRDELFVYVYYSSYGGRYVRIKVSPQQKREIDSWLGPHLRRLRKKI